MFLLTNSGTVNPWISVSLMLLGGLIAASFAVIFLVKNAKLREAIIRAVLLAAGGLALLLGIIGIFLPIMPTVPFVILTAMCWGRASPRFHYWLINHKIFGPMIRDWLERRAIPRRAKYLAWTMMSISSIAMIVRFPERWYVGAVIGAVCLCVGLWMAKLPDA